MAIRILSSENVDGALTIGGALTGTTASFTRLDINASNTKLKGDLLANTDAAYDIGASGANRPRNLYLSNSITAGDITTTGVGTFGGNVTTNGDIIIDNSSGDPFLKLKTSAQEYVIRVDQSDSEKFQIRDVTNSLTRITLDTSGNVGIGTTSPDYDLDVERTATTINDDPTIGIRNAWSGEGNNTGFSNRADLLNSAGAGAVIVRTRARYDATANWGEIGTTTAHDFNIRTSGTNRITVQAAGNVGIGVVNPETSRLLVRGSTNDSTSQIFQAANFGGASKYVIRADGDNKWYKSDNSLSMVLTSTGNVGIGATSPAVRLDFGSATGKAFHLYTSGADYYGFNMLQYDSGPFSTNIFSGNGGEIKLRTVTGSSTAVTRLTVKAAGNVGIGTTSPDYKLEVNGGTDNVIALFESTDNKVYIGFKDNGTTSIPYVGADDNDLFFLTSGSERIRIAANGAIGIGGTNYGTSGQVLTSNGNAAPSWQAGGGGGGASSLNGLSDCLVVTTSLAVGTVPSNLSSSSVSNTILGLSAGSSLAVSKQNTIIGENAASNAVGIEEGNVYTNLSNNAQNHTAGTYTLSVAGQFPWDPSNDFTITINSSGIFSAVTDASNPPYQTVGTVTVPTSLIGGSSAETFTSTYLSNAKFENNVILGHDAWNTGTLGQDLVVIGTNAAYSAGTGTSNQSFDSVVIGKDASYYTQDLQNTVIIGSEAFFYGQGGVSSATARNGVVIGSGAMKGISTTDYVNDYGSVAIGYRAAFRNKSGTSYNVAIGLQSLYGFPPSFPSTTGLTGDNNVAIGRNSGYRIQSGSNNICVGYNAGDTSSPVTITSQSNYICLGNNSITNAYIRVAFTVTSDERDKAEIKPLGLGLDFINNLKPISFKFKKEVGEEYIKNEEGNEEELNPNYIPSRESTEVEQEQRYGFSAQDVLLLEGDEPVIVDNKNTEKLGLRTEVIIPILVKAIQELKAEIEILKNK